MDGLDGYLRVVVGIEHVLITTTLMLRQDALPVSELKPMNSIFMTTVTLIMTYAAPVMDKGKLSLHICKHSKMCRNGDT